MADPDFVFMDGFDKYGPVNTRGDQFIRAISVSNEWSGIINNTTFDTNFKAATPIGSSTGVSFQISDSDLSVGAGVCIFKTLPASYRRALGGIYYKANTLSYIHQIVSFYDTPNASIQVFIGMDTSGRLGVWRGPTSAGTRIGTGTSIYSTASAIGIEWDITFSNTVGIIKIWVDGVLEIDLTAQDTCSTASENFNRVYVGVFANGAVGSGLVGTLTYDHFYLWGYSAIGGTETPVGAGFQIQTSFPTADSSPSQFNSRRYIGNYSLTTVTGSNNGTSINMTGPFTVPANCNGLGIVFFPDDTVAGTNLTYVGIYAASGGTPTTLLAQASTSSTAGQQANGLYFDTPVVLTAGQQVFLAHTTNFSTTTQWLAGAATTPTYNCTRASFGPLPTTSLALGTAYTTQMAIGLIASGFTSGKFDTMDLSPPLSSFIYNFDSTVNDVDAYSFGGLEGSPTSISYVALKGALSRTNTGSRTTQLEVDSAGTISAGTLAAFTPALTGGDQIGGPVYGTYFKNDPATSAAWTNSAAAGIKGRVKVVS